MNIRRPRNRKLSARLFIAFTENHKTGADVLTAQMKQHVLEHRDNYMRISTFNCR
jgi:galactokinase/mevalonate kinase-like predicted kinase